MMSMNDNDDNNEDDDNDDDHHKTLDLKRYIPLRMVFFSLSAPTMLIV